MPESDVRFYCFVNCAQWLYFFDMNELSKTQLKCLFYAIEINLLIWLAVTGAVVMSSADPIVKQMTGAGAIIAAVIQHWAYYNIYKKLK
jgi:hypothetical protein